jgi:hypothetical protein
MNKDINTPIGADSQLSSSDLTQQSRVEVDVPGMLMRSFQINNVGTLRKDQLYGKRFLYHISV